MATVCGGQYGGIVIVIRQQRPGLERFFDKNGKYLPVCRFGGLVVCVWPCVVLVDCATGIGRATAKRPADVLGLNEKQAIDLPMHQLGTLRPSMAKLAQLRLRRPAIGHCQLPPNKLSGVATSALTAVLRRRGGGGGVWTARLVLGDAGKGPGQVSDAP